MLQITETDRDRIVRNLDMMRAHCNAIHRILEHEIAAANAIHAGIADAIMILANLRPDDGQFFSRNSTRHNHLFYKPFEVNCDKLS